MIFSNTTFYIAKTHDESSKNDILLEFIEDIIGAKSISLYKILNSLLKKTIILKDSKCEFSYLYKKMQVNETEIDELFNSLEAFGLISIFKNTTNQNIIIHINEIPSFKTITSNIMLNSYIKSKLTNEKLEEYKTLLTPVYQNNGLFEDISCTVEQFLKAKEYHVSNIQDEVINTSLCSFFKLPINYNDELNNIIEKCKKEFSIEKIIELMKESANKFETFVEIDTKVLQEKINTARNIIIPLVSNTIYRDSFIWEGKCTLEQKEQIFASYKNNTPFQYLSKIYKTDVNIADNYVIVGASNKGLSDEIINIIIDYTINSCKYQSVKQNKINVKYFDKVCATILEKNYTKLDDVLLHFIRSFTKGAITSLPWDQKKASSANANKDLIDDEEISLK